MYLIISCHFLFPLCISVEWVPPLHLSSQNIQFFFLILNVVLFVFLFSNSSFIFIGRFSGWAILSTLFSIELYYLFWIWSPSLSSDGSNVHVPTILFGILTATFTSIFLKFPSLIIFVLVNIMQKYCFPNFLVS